MKIPERIQRKRTPGYRQPPNCRYCGRGTKYGNDYKIVKVKEVVIVRYVENEKTGYKSNLFYDGESCYLHAVTLYDEIQMEINLSLDLAFYDNLLNFDYISCFCPKHLPCHCDAIIEHLAERVQQLQAVAE